jgi:hypothetical protein
MRTAPFLNRSLTLHLYGDWGQANLHRITLDRAEGLLQHVYWAACQSFSADPAARTCIRCTTTQPPLDLIDIHWPEVAAALVTQGLASRESQ